MLEKSKNECRIMRHSFLQTPQFPYGLMMFVVFAFLLFSIKKLLKKCTYFLMPFYPQTQKYKRARGEQNMCKCLMFLTGGIFYNCAFFNYFMLFLYIFAFLQKNASKYSKIIPRMHNYKKITPVENIGYLQMFCSPRVRL